MVDLNVTLLESHDEDVKQDQDNKVKVEEDGKHHKRDINVETHPCDQCEKFLQK